MVADRVGPQVQAAQAAAAEAAGQRRGAAVAEAVGPEPEGGDEGAVGVGGCVRRAEVVAMEMVGMKVVGMEVGGGWSWCVVCVVWCVVCGWCWW